MDRHLLPLLWIAVLAAQSVFAADPAAKKADSAPDDDTPATFAGRSFEEWKRLTVKDLDENTRYQGYSALAAFAKNGHEKEAVATLQAALDKESSYVGFVKGYAAVKVIGRGGDSILIHGLGQGVLRRDRAILGVLQESASAAPGDALIEALIKKIKDKSVDPTIRSDACRAVANQVMSSSLVATDPTNPKRQDNPSIEPQLNLIVPVLEAMLKDEDPRVCNNAAICLVKTTRRRPKLMATVLDYVDSELTNPRPIPVSAANQPPQMIVSSGSTSGNFAGMSGLSSGHVSNMVLEAISREAYTDFQLREVLTQSLPHLKSLSDKHKNTTNGYLPSLIHFLESRQSRPRVAPGAGGGF